ncbi:MAG: histidine phosphatase family protein [Anaerolineae bacterium]|nr:MAG: histidine phosphatase family protein [Anaerolineae bacterium]
MCYYPLMTYILLVRHGQNEWVREKRLAGWVPGVQLNEEGRNEVKLLAQRLSSLPIKMIYSSPLERCMETAKILAEPNDVQVESKVELGEVRYGKWEGKKLKKLARKKRKWYLVQHFPSRFRFPAGESFVEVQTRAVNTVEKLSQSLDEEFILLVSHADVIKLVLAHYLGMHIDLFQRLAVSPASVSILALTGRGSVNVLRINDSGPIKLHQRETSEKSGTALEGETESDHE